MDGTSVLFGNNRVIVDNVRFSDHGRGKKCVQQRRALFGCEVRLQHHQHPTTLRSGIGPEPRAAFLATREVVVVDPALHTFSEAYGLLVIL